MWPGLSMSFLKICLLCQNLLIFTNILIMILLRETASLGHIIHYCITLRPNTHSQLQTLRPIFHSHHTPTKLTSKAMFGNFFFSLFFIFKNNFLFLRLKNLFGNSKWTENKNCFQNSIYEGNWKHTKCCFQFLIFKSQWKHAFNLMNFSYLMS